MSVVDAILPVLLISILGYVLARFGFFSAEGHKALSRLTFTILIPSLLFLGVIKSNLGNIFYFPFLASYFIPVVIVFLVAQVVSRLFLNLGATGRGVFSTGAAYSNATVIGIPICLYTLGEESLVPLSIIVTFHNFILFTLGTIAAESRQFSVKNVVNQMAGLLQSFVTNPITLALIAGVLVNVFAVPIPPVLFESISFVSEAAVPIAFLVLGASISDYGLRGQWLPVLFLVPIKLFLLPLLVWFFTFRVFDSSVLWGQTAVMIAAGPVGIATYVFAQRYQSGESYLATSILVSTILSVVSFGFWLNWMGVS